MRGEGGLAVIEMKGFEVGETDGFVKAFHGLGEGGGGAEVVASGEGMARIDADANAGFIVDMLYYIT